MSQPNEITLSVDVLNNGTGVNRVYTNWDRTSSRSMYIGPTHTALERDTLTLFRSPAKPNGNFAGVEKTTIKFSEDAEVLGNDGATTIRAPKICEISFSLPVGVTAAEKVEFRQRAIAALDHTIMTSFQEQLVI